MAGEGAGMTGGRWKGTSEGGWQTGRGLTRGEVAIESSHTWGGQEGAGQSSKHPQ